jgi:hypothetical protein
MKQCPSRFVPETLRHLPYFEGKTEHPAENQVILVYELRHPYAAKHTAMKKRLLILLLVCSAAGVSAQEEQQPPKVILHDGSAFLGSFYTPMLGEPFIGGAFSVKGYLSKRYAVGFSMSYAYRETPRNFEKPAGSPVLDYFEWGIEQQYDFVQRSRLRAGASLNNGIGMVQLSDWDSVIQYVTSRGLRDRAKPVSTNYFYQVQPGLDVAVRCTSGEKPMALYITGKVKYNIMIGPTRFGTTSDFCKPYFGLGLMLAGVMKE